MMRSCRNPQDRGPFSETTSHAHASLRQANQGYACGRWLYQTLQFLGTVDLKISLNQPLDQGLFQFLLNKRNTKKNIIPVLVCWISRGATRKKRLGPKTPDLKDLAAVPLCRSKRMRRSRSSRSRTCFAMSSSLSVWDDFSALLWRFGRILRWYLAC